MTAKAILVLAMALTACSAPPDERLKIARDAALANLRDPASAEFRNERIRTLWSDQGDRKVIYCAEINANNALGGKTGFMPYSYQLETLKNGAAVEDWFNGEATFPTKGSTNWYADCIREDTQRDGDGFLARFPEFQDSPDGAKAEVDQHLHVISMKPAPD